MGMIYEYTCAEHGKFEIIKPMEDAAQPEYCPTCKAPLTRLWLNRSGFNGEKVEHAEFNPGLGCVVRNRKHREEVARRKGLVEIGNESVDTIHKTAERDQEEARNKRYDDAIKEAANGL